MLFHDPEGAVQRKPRLQQQRYLTCKKRNISLGDFVLTDFFQGENTFSRLIVPAYLKGPKALHHQTPGHRILVNILPKAFFDGIISVKRLVLIESHFQSLCRP